MRRIYSVTVVPLSALLVLAAAASGQPRIANGQVSTRPAGTPFAESFRSLVAAQTGIGWIGYGVPVVAGDRDMCCAGSGGVWVSGSVVVSDRGTCCSSCRIEPNTAGQTAPAGASQSASGPIRLEASTRISILFRVAAGAVERIRVFSEDCELDAGGRAVTWLENVRPADSIALLETFATAPAADRRDAVSDGAISAIALHADPAADASLDRLVAVSQPEAVRRKVPFWLGNARGARGLEVLRRLLRDDPSAEVRKRSVFGLSQSREPEAFDALAGVARSGSTPALRSEAVFWVAQSGRETAPGIVLEVLEKDAAEVRKKAVFALSQLRNNAGVDPLIRVARTHTDPSIRGEAIFWLGQKAGAKAAAEITERIDQDPDTEVKKRAVFALSQLPKDEGVPLLIKVARTNPNAAVRKQAMFWLGQSRDQRAIDFFAEILK